MSRIRNFCAKSLKEIIKGNYYLELSQDDINYLETELASLNKVDKIAEILLKLNKHTKTGSLSFSFTDELINRIKHRNIDDLFYEDHSWPEVYENDDLTEKEKDDLEDIFNIEYSLAREACYENFSNESCERIFPITKKKKLSSTKNDGISIYENCHSGICVIKKEKEKEKIPEVYIDNIVKMNVLKTVSKGSIKRIIKTEVCYNLYELLEYLYKLEINRNYTCNITLTKDELVKIKNILGVEYLVYRFYRDNNCR